MFKCNVFSSRLLKTVTQSLLDFSQTPTPGLSLEPAALEVRVKGVQVLDLSSRHVYNTVLIHLRNTVQDGVNRVLRTWR
jgi:hypothetical protein